MEFMVVEDVIGIVVVRGAVTEEVTLMFVIECFVVFWNVLVVAERLILNLVVFVAAATSMENKKTYEITKNKTFRMAVFRSLNSVFRACSAHCSGSITTC